MEITNHQVVSSLWWKILERIFTQGVGIIIQIVLARILMPEDFGILAIIIAITNYAGIFVQSGLSTAIVQKKDLEVIDIGTLLISSFTIAAFMFTVIYLAAPIIASSYSLPNLLWPLRVVAIVLFFNAINSVQTALYIREMRFKSLFFRSVLAVLLSGTVGILMAYRGFGVWALVAYNIVNILTIVIYMSLDKKAKLNFQFSWTRAKSLYAFSGKILIANLISGFGDTLKTMIIGKKYSPNDLAYYDKAYTYSSYITQSITLSLSTVLLPAFSSKQDDFEQLKKMARKSLQMTAFLVIPVLTAVMMTSESLVLLLLTEKWLPCVPYLMIFCLLRIPGCLTSIDKQVYFAIGNSSISLYYEIFVLVANVFMLIITVPISIYAIAIGATIIEIIGCTILFVISRRVYNYGLRERLSDLIKPMVYSVAMALSIYGLSFFALNILLSLILQFSLGFCVYYGMAKLFNDSNLLYLKAILKNKINN